MVVYKELFKNFKKFDFNQFDGSDDFDSQDEQNNIIEIILDLQQYQQDIVRQKIFKEDL